MELTFVLHGGYYVSKETMIDLYYRFRPGRKIEEDFDGNAFILSPDDLTLDEELWILHDRYVQSWYILASVPDRKERQVIEERYHLAWCHAKKPNIARIDRPELFVLLSQLEREQPAHNR